MAKIQQRITPMLWFDTQAEEAANFYCTVFKNSKVTAVSRYGNTGPGPKGSVMVAEFGVCWATSTLAQTQRWYERAAAMIGKGQYPLVKAFVYYDAEACEKPTGTSAMAASFRHAVSVPRLRQPRPY